MIFVPRPISIVIRSVHSHSKVNSFFHLQAVLFVIAATISLAILCGFEI